MDALVSAFVAALLAECGDRTPWLAAMLAARFQRPVSVVLGIALAAASASALSATFGALIAPLLVPNARLLFLALALLFGGAGAFLPLRAPNALAGWRIGAFATSALGFFILEFGDRTQFLTAALALRSPVPALAAVGATLGILAVSIPAALAGEAVLKRLPPIATRIVPGVLFLLTGMICALAALRLI